MAKKKQQPVAKPVAQPEPVLEPVDDGWGTVPEQPVATQPDDWQQQEQSMPVTPVEPVVEGQLPLSDPAWEVPNGVPEALAEQPASEWVEPTKTVLVPLTIVTHTGHFDPDRAKFMFYGESGSGKTRLASTFPDVIFADIDKGMGSVTEMVDQVLIDDFKNLERMYAFLADGKHGYNTVVIDTLNEMQRIAMGATVEDFPAVKRAYNDLPSESDYGKMLHDMVELTLKFIELPMRVVLVSQVNSRQFDTDLAMPQLIGKNTARQLCRKMDVIGYIYKGEKDDGSGHKLSEVSFDNANYVTKDRSFKLPAVLPDPSWQRISSFWK